MIDYQTWCRIRQLYDEERLSAGQIAREMNSILDFLMSHLFSFIVTNEQLVKIERCYKVTLNAAF